MDFTLTDLRKLRMDYKAVTYTVCKPVLSSASIKPGAHNLRFIDAVDRTGLYRVTQKRETNCI